MATKLQQQGVMAKLTSLKGFVQRFAFVSMFILAFALTMLGKAENVMIERVRMAVTDFAAPLLDALSRPTATVADFVAQMHEMMNLREENQRLREENARLRAWHGAATRLAAENEALRGLLNYVPAPRSTFISARVVGDGGGPFVRSVLINAGRSHGVEKGQAVLNEDGLIGRVTEVGRRSARLLLLTDFNSRVPVVLETSRDRAILAGDNSPMPQLSFLPPTAQPKMGERVVTSGHGGVLPAGLPVGVVAGMRDGIPRIQPFVAFDKLEYVRIIDFGPIPAPEGADVDEPIILMPERGLPQIVVKPTENTVSGDDADEAPPPNEILPTPRAPATRTQP